MVDDVDKLVARTPAQFARAGISAHIHHRVEAIDLTAQRVTVRDLEAHQTRAEAYDQLLLATGALPIVPDLPGIDARGIYAVKSLESGKALRDALKAPDVRDVVIVGGGYIGIEMADNLVGRVGRVTLIDRHSALMPALDPELGQLVTAAAQRLGVTVRLDETALAFETRQGSVRAVVTDRGRYPADLVVLGLGVEPDVELVRHAAIAQGVRGAIQVDARMATALPGVYAAGDCVQSWDLVGRRFVYRPLGTTANKQGRVAGLNIAGGSAHFPGIVGTAIARIGDTEVARTGLGATDVSTLGLDALSVRIETHTHPGYLPNAAPITVGLWGERGSGRLLGGQIVGGAGAGKRIDVLATALSAVMTVADLIDLDLAYAPPFSDVWDPVQIAARQLAPRL